MHSSMYCRCDTVESAGAMKKPYWYQPGQVEMPALDVVATCNDAGTEWSLAVANRHASKPMSCAILLGSRPLTGDDANSYNDVDAPDRVAPEQTTLRFENGQASFAPHSVTIVKSRSE